MVKRFKWYPAEDEKKHFSRKSKSKESNKPTKLRQGLKPGSILIILAGRFRGRRVIVLKQLKSGLLLVTGPYKVNGVPLKRISQAFVIPTSTHIDIGDIAPEINDDYFKKAKDAKNQKFFKEETERKIPDGKKQMQKKVDEAIMGKLDKKSMEYKYLQARFTLRNNMRIHEMVF